MRISKSKSEAESIIKDIVPTLEKLGWARARMSFEVQCGVGRIDLLYKDTRGHPLTVIEATRPGGNEKNIEKKLRNQAIPYAKSVKAPIAIAWDGVGKLKTFHIKDQQPLYDYDGEQISHATHSLLSESNLMFLARKGNSSLKAKIKTPSEMRGFFKQLNKLGRNANLSTGVERIAEIAKILFIKILCDNQVYLESNDWEELKRQGNVRAVSAVNEKLKRLSEENNIKVPSLNVAKEKNKEIWKIIEMLDTVNFNRKYYDDIVGSLFEFFLSERARGGTTNDLGQYFTPKKIIALLYCLSGFKPESENKATIYDPYCGTAGILLEFYRQSDEESEIKSQKFAKKNLFGSEGSLPIALLAKMNMVIAGDGHANIHDGDSLSRENSFIQKRFDFVVTNMPFDPSAPSDVPDGYFAMSADSDDVSKFIEHCVNRCKGGGRIVLIVGKGFLTKKITAGFRRKILEKYCLEAVYLLYDGVFHPYTQAFSSILVISKKAPASHVDFFSIDNDSAIEIAKKYYNKTDRYKKGFYKVARKDILGNEDCDWRGKIYERRTPKGMLKIRDLVNCIEKKKAVKPKGRKMTPPNSIEDGIELMDTKSNKLVDYGKDSSFLYKVEKNSIVVARIVGNRNEGKYLGSAIAGKDHGSLITGENYQFIPKDPSDVYYLLHRFRNAEFQNDIVELAKGTSGQQRIDKRDILDSSIPKPTKKSRNRAKEELLKIEKCRRTIKTKKKEIGSIKEKIQLRIEN